MSPRQRISDLTDDDLIQLRDRLRQLVPGADGFSRDTYFGMSPSFSNMSKELSDL